MATKTGHIKSHEADYQIHVYIAGFDSNIQNGLNKSVRERKREREREREREFTGEPI